MAFLSSVPVSAIAIVFCVALFVTLGMKGISPLVSGIICAAIISLTSTDGFVTSFFTTFVGGITTLVGWMFGLMVIGSAFGGVLEATGASERIGKTFVKRLGSTNFIFAIVLANMLLAATGAVPWVLMAFLSFGMLREADLPRYIGMVAVTGTMVISQNVLPGATTLNNLLPAAALGVNIYSAPLLGILTTIFALALNAFYLLHLIKEARKKGLHYEVLATDSNATLREEKDLPSFWGSFIPVVVLLGFCFVAVLVFKMDSARAVVYATVIGTAMLYLFNRKYMRGTTLFGAIQKNVFAIVPGMVGAACAYGFACCVIKTPAFTALGGAISQSNWNPYILTLVGVCIMVAVMADGNSGFLAFISMMGDKLVAMGIDPSVLHRLGAICASSFDTLPHNSFINCIIPTFGYDIKTGYRYVFISNCLIPLAYSIFATVLALIIY